jgi:chitin synthase
MAKAFRKAFRVRYLSTWLFHSYRLRTPDTHKPLLISNQLVDDYSENRVDTLHMKNLLHLGDSDGIFFVVTNISNANNHFPLFIEL